LTIDNHSFLTISVVIVSYNSEKFLEENLQSLIRQTVKFTSIVVVDNHSADHSPQVIESFKDEIEFIALPSNCGYSRAANIGIDHIFSGAGADLILVANSDIILDENFNARVTGKFKEIPSLGMLSPLILRFDRKTVDSAGQACSRTLHPSEIGFNRPVDEVDTREKTVFSVCGAATVFSRGALERLKIHHEYYVIRDWNKATGKPSKKRLETLGMPEIATSIGAQ
jgi:GT2 family glycosyltransferase